MAAHDAGMPVTRRRTWLCAAPAKHSTRKINEVHVRIGLLVECLIDATRPVRALARHHGGSSH
jgi:hypothetical protein